MAGPQNAARPLSSQWFNEDNLRVTISHFAKQLTGGSDAGLLLQGRMHEPPRPVAKDWPA
jgi:hypothetical protein